MKKSTKYSTNDIYSASTLCIMEASKTLGVSYGRQCNLACLASWSMGLG